jgi:hypothetical protein
MQDTPFLEEWKPLMREQRGELEKAIWRSTDAELDELERQQQAARYEVLRRHGVSTPQWVLDIDRRLGAP